MADRNRLPASRLYSDPVRIKDDPALIRETMKTGIKELEKLQRETKAQIPMSEYVKILLWGKNELWRLEHEKLMREVAEDVKNGWTVVSHTWCGQDWDEFEIPSLGLYADKPKKDKK